MVRAEPAGEVPQFALRRPRRQGKRLKGLKYEKQGLEYLAERYPEGSLASPWFRFVSYHDQSRLRWCQPDALLFDFPRGIITIVEFKWKHTSDAWWQTRHLYEPVMRCMFPSDLWRIRICEIVRWFDPATRFPERFDVVGCPEEIPINGIGVLIWAKGREFGHGRAIAAAAGAAGDNAARVG